MRRPFPFPRLFPRLRPPRRPARPAARTRARLSVKSWAALAGAAAVILALPAPQSEAAGEWDSVICEIVDGAQVCRRCEYVNFALECVVEGRYRPAPRVFWTPWKAIGPCDGSVWDSHNVVSGVLFKRSLYREENGRREFIRSQNECVDDARQQAWDELERRIAQLPAPSFDRSPRRVGVTGLETRLWYEPPARIAPVTARIQRPNGLSYRVQGRSWIRSLTWDMGEGAVTERILSYPNSGEGGYGSSGRWLAGHTYRTTARRAGHADGEYPIRVTATWAGQYRADMGHGWSAWLPIPETLPVSRSFTYRVREITSVLGPVKTKK